MPYWQDFRWHEGIPHDVEFEVDKVASHGDFWLKGKGYGILNKNPSEYGNGSIAVKFDIIIEHLIEQT